MCGYCTESGLPGTANAEIIAADFGAGPRGSALAFPTLAVPLVAVFVILFTTQLDLHGFGDWFVAIVGGWLCGLTAAFGVLLFTTRDTRDRQ